MAVFKLFFSVLGATRCRNWFRHCATSWKVAGSIPDSVIMGGVCGAYGGGESCAQGSGGET